MPKTNKFAQDFLKLVFQAVSITGVATTTGTNAWVSLYTTTPGVAGTAITNEAAYTSYARVSTTKNTTDWILTGQTINPKAAGITFPTSTGAPSETETFFGIVSTASGAGDLWYFGSISPTITVNAAGITPQLTSATAITEA